MTHEELMRLADAQATERQHSHYHPELEARAALSTALTEVLEERDALAKDAARYRWLRDKSNTVYLKDGPDDHGWFPSDSEDIDAAADAAMKGQTHD